MILDASFLGLALIVLIAFTVEAATGFGAMIIGLALAASLYSITELLPRLVLLDAILCGYLAYRGRDTIDVSYLVRRVLPLVTVGVVIGLAIGLPAPDFVLRRLVGVLVMSVAAWDLIALIRASHIRTPLSPSIRVLGLLGSGVMHGLAATGGPLLAYVMGRSELDKATYRTTMALVWVVLDVLLLATYAAAGRMTSTTLNVTAALLPSLAIALVLGERLHRRVNERRFRMLIMAVLVVIGLALTFSARPDGQS